MHVGIALGHAVPGGINLPEPSNLSVHELTTLDVAHNSDGRLEVFGVDPLGDIWHTWQTAPGADWSGSWSELDGDGENLSSLRVVQNADGRLEVFAVTARGNVWHTWQTTAGGAWAGTWAQLYTDGEMVVTIDAARNGDGRLEVFGIDPMRRRLAHVADATPVASWSGTWHKLHTDEGRLSSLRVGQNADGRLEVFGIDRRANIWHTWQRSNGGTWADGWTPLYTDRDELAMLDVTTELRRSPRGIRGRSDRAHLAHRADVRRWRLDRTMERSLRRTATLSRRCGSRRTRTGAWRCLARARTATSGTPGRRRRVDRGAEAGQGSTSAPVQSSHSCLRVTATAAWRSSPSTPRAVLCARRRPPPATAGRP